jgi:hypothetical protein
MWGGLPTCGPIADRSKRAQLARVLAVVEKLIAEG